jgi:hypothetical protein
MPVLAIDLNLPWSKPDFGGRTSSVADQPFQGLAQPIHRVKPIDIFNCEIARKDDR